jgi:hypothetical protein
MRLLKLLFHMVGKFLEMSFLLQSETIPQVSSETHTPSPLWSHMSIFAFDAVGFVVVCHNFTTVP